MRYTRHMTAVNTLPAYAPHKWAAVVSGVFWKRWALSPSGSLEGQTVRGPLIVWASQKNGEEEAPQVGTPSPSPLELRVLEVNTRAHFEKFRRAAHGKVRASVRWKSRRLKLKAVYISFVKTFLPFAPSTWPTVKKSYLLDLKRRRARLAQKPDDSAAAWKFNKRWVTDPKTGQPITKDPHSYFELIRSYFNTIGPRAYSVRERDSWELSPSEVDFLDYFDEDLGEDISEVAPSDWDNKSSDYVAFYASELHFIPPRKFKKGVSDWLNIALLGYSVRCELVRGLKTPAHFALFIKSLITALYLAHVRRRIKPAPRRDRLPRPVHTRPRPPSAPLAPPVTC